MSFFSSSSSTAIRQSALNILHHSSPFAPQCQSSRRFNSATPKHARQVLGRIDVKQIGVPLRRGSGQASGSLPRPHIWRPIAFFLGVSTVTYIAAAEYTNRDTAYWASRLGSGGAGAWWRRSTGSGVTGYSDREMARAKTLESARKAQAHVNALPQILSFLPPSVVQPIMRLYVTSAEFFINRSPAQIVPLGLISGMATVWIMWKIPRYQGFMRRWFLSHPVVYSSTPSKAWANCVGMATSVFSHQSGSHLLFNSIGLYSFGAAAYTFLATPPPSPQGFILPSATYTPHFLAFFLTAGLFASLASTLYTNIFRLPLLLRTLASPARLSSAQALAAHYAISPSLGASGAVYATLTLTALAYPNTSVSLIFLPFFPIPISLGVGGLVLFDIVALIRGWRVFDHVAHLGGALFGVLYYQYGREFFLSLRRRLQKDRVYSR
ncbi:hypothetical protein BCR39DRAFT_525865 [Naematelia encephala]|uniref:Peptidase S54 rhomboid domain-containing protein n=1 Tax=Naematelia encephala TaxID=71784 RepID=A0A1Y2B9T8_9TREE|nr:hypothetical protein BCR39DRAFT_525865 [Naematelia encephala]